MALDLSTCTFLGPALPAPFVKLDLEAELHKAKLLPKMTGDEGHALQDAWDAYRRKLRELIAQGGAIRVLNHVIDPLVARFGYAKIEQADPVRTRLEPDKGESGGWLMQTADGTAKLRVWAVSLNEDLDAPAKRGAAYRYSHLRIAQRVLLASTERVGLLTNGVQLRLLISDPARPDSEVLVPIDPDWRRARAVPDSFALVLALCCPAGVKAVPDLVDKARLKQATVTKELRRQAREAIELFVQGVLDHPDNRDALAATADRARLARDLWHEGLVLIYRLLFLLKGEATDDPARVFQFASSTHWRNTYSPSMGLARYARAVLDQGAETGGLLEGGLRALFRMFEDGLDCTEMHVKPLGGALFGENATPRLSKLHWGERACAHLLDRLLWTPRRRGAGARERVHYGPLDVEDLGRVYEALLELEPGIATEPMCRLRRAKLEVVLPVAQGEKYRPAEVPPPDGPADAPNDPPADVSDESDPSDPSDQSDQSDGSDESDEEASPQRGRKTKVEWIEAIPPGRFYLRVGLGRKSSGSFYTPHSFVRFLVKETLEPQLAERSPEESPHPAEILKLKVLDPAMGSGHFLVEACRFLGEHFYEACRLCDEKALAAERKAEAAAEKDNEPAFNAAEAEARKWRQRIIELPDPNDELLRYMPSRSSEGGESGLSQKKAMALCRRLVAVHCLYGVDKNPLAVELAKLALWLESHAEGLPLTFLDHRLVVGDSLTGPFWDRLITKPSKAKEREKLDDLFTQGLSLKFTNALARALATVRDLEATVGATVAENEAKQTLKRQLDEALLPFKVIAAAWSGGVMLGPDRCDDHAYGQLVKAVCETGSLPDRIESEPLRHMLARGLGVEAVPAEGPALAALVASGVCVPALPYDLAFPEVFYPNGEPGKLVGFDAVIGNPPWEAIQFKSREFFASFDFEIMNAPTKRERTAIEKRLTADPQIGALFESYKESFEELKRSNDVLYKYQKVQVEGDLAGRQVDMFRVFMERNAQLLCATGFTGVVVPSAFHANEGATGIRRLYLEQMALRCCYSFENKRKLFEIHASFKFAPVVASKTGPTAQFPCGFYLHDDEWLFAHRGDAELRYSLEFVRRTGREYLALLELRSNTDLEVARVCFGNGHPFGQVCNQLDIRFGCECHMTNDAWLFTPVADLLAKGEDPRQRLVKKSLLDQGYLTLHEGKSFWHYDDGWSERPRYLVALSRCLGHTSGVLRFKTYRLAYRAIASSTNERTSVFAVLPPGAICGHSVGADQSPLDHAACTVLHLEAVCNSFPFDWCLRQIVSSNVTQYMLLGAPFVSCGCCRPLLVHGAGRLTCNHGGYASLWGQIFKNLWREPNEPLTWPVLAGEEERWEVRSAIDAVVAEAYGLSREQYAHVLSTFSHKSYPKAPALCLAKFDELKRIGLDAFTKKHDPYWDIPLNEGLPEPDPIVSAAIEKALAEAAKSEAGDPPAPKSDLFGAPIPTDMFGQEVKPKGRRRRRN